MKQFLVIGAGRFGAGLVKELSSQGAEVIVWDKNKKKLEEVEEYATHCFVGDLRENDIIDQMEIEEFDAVFTAIGTDAYSAILIVKKLKERNAKKIIAKAIKKEVGEILLALGASKVVYPEEEAGMKIARQEYLGEVKDFFEISRGVSAVEIPVPEQLWGQTLSGLDFSRKFGLNVSLLVRKEKAILSHFADLPFEEGDYLVVVGENKKIMKFRKKFS